MLRLLADSAGEQTPTATLLSYVGAFDIYRAIGDQCGEEDRGYHALTLLHTARLHLHPAAALIDILPVAQRPPKSQRYGERKEWLEQLS